MAGLRAALLMGAVLLGVQCNEDIVSVISRIDHLNGDVIRVEERVLHQIDLAKISLRSELKQHISEHVKEAIAGILQGESVEEMVNSQVITEVRQLKRENKKMKRQVRRVLKSLTEIRQEQRLCSESLQKTQTTINEINSCSKCVVDAMIHKWDLERCENNTAHYRQQAPEKDQNIIEETVVVQTTTKSPPPSVDSTTSASASTSLTTASGPGEETRRIIIAPIWSSRKHRFQQLNIDSKTVSTYPLRSLKNVESVAYVSKLRKLLISLDKPSKIISSSLDSDNVTTMKTNVKAPGMAVDEEREVVFMTTVVPPKTISHMTTQGKNFTVLTDLSKYDEWPRGIAVDRKRKELYVCNTVKVLKLNYDGTVVRKIASGKNMFALILDNTGSILYYNNGKKMRKMYLYQNLHEDVITMDVIPWNFKYYHHTVYYSSHATSAGKIGAVGVSWYTGYSTMTNVSLSGVSSYAICLI